MLKVAVYILIALSWLRRILKRAAAPKQPVHAKSVPGFGPGDLKKFGIYVVPFEDLRLDSYRYGNIFEMSNEEASRVAFKILNSEPYRKFFLITDRKYEISVQWYSDVLGRFDKNISELLCKYPPEVSHKLLHLLNDVQHMCRETV